MTAFFSTLLLLVFLALPGVVAVRLSGYFFGEAEWWRRGFAACCIYPLIIFAVLMLLAPFALIKALPIFVLMLILATASLAIPSAPWRVEAMDRKFLEPWWQVALATGLAVTGIAIFAFSNYATGVQFMSDDFAYHGPTIAAWFRTGTLDHPRIMFPAYYPFNGHMITLYMLMPTGDLRWTFLATFLWLIIGFVALLHLTACLTNYRLGWGLLAVAVFLFCTEVAFYHFYTLCPNDVVGAVAFLSAFVVAFPRSDSPLRESLARVFLSGAMLGFAMGTKSTFAVPGIVGGFGLLVIAVLGSRGARVWARLGTSAGLLAIAAFAAGSYWYLWNWIHARNPVFPAKVLDFRGPGNEKSWGDSTLLYHIKNAEDNGIWWEIGRQVIHWPWPLGMISLLGLLGLVVFVGWLLLSAFRQRSAVPLGHPMLWMFLAGMTLIVQYPFMPFTGSFFTPELVVNHRYFLFLFTVGVVACFWGLSNIDRVISNPILAKIVNGIAVLVVASAILHAYRHNSVSIGTTQEVPALVAGALVMLAMLLVGLKKSTSDCTIRRPVAILCSAGAVVVLLVLGTVRERILPPPYMKFLEIPATAPLPRIINAIDQLPEGSRIGKFCLNAWEYAYLCGSRFQHEPVILWEQGPELITLHDAYYARMIDIGYPRFGVPQQGHLPNPDTFTDKLREVDLDYLLVTQYLMGAFDGTWPPQRPFIQQMPEFELVWSDENSEIYRRLPDTPVEAPATP